MVGIGCLSQCWKQQSSLRSAEDVLGLDLNLENVVYMYNVLVKAECLGL